MKKTIIMGIVLSSLTAMAGFERVSYSTQDIGVSRSASRSEFSDVKVSGIESSKIVGGPELPVQSYLLNGTPEQIEVKLNVRSQHVLNNVKPSPVQRQACRCDDNSKRSGFAYDESKYVSRSKAFQVQYLGAFRGQHISRLDVNLAKFNAQDNSTQFYTDVEVMHNTSAAELREQKYNDYLILVPQPLEKGVEEFVTWKTSQGYKVTVKSLTTVELNKEGIQKYIAEQFKTNGIDFVIIVGDEKTVPMFMVDTSSDPDTPSDLPYYTMDGPEDHIADMFGSRISATTAEQVTAELAKSIEYEKASFKDAKGMSKIVGIASSEGNNPSDNDYITSIEDSYKTAWKYEPSHFYQKDKKSNPTNITAELNSGVHWIYYVGHGSGTSWPSLNLSYSTTDIVKMKNVDVVKPIVVDVACQNGRLLPSYFGSTFMNVNTKTGAYGVLAYLGGSVNVSWHPPALMARGIAFEHTKKNFQHLGEAILAGQLYLAANYNVQDDIVDNYEWYHLQGDPGLRIDHK